MRSSNSMVKWLRALRQLGMVLTQLAPMFRRLRYGGNYKIAPRFRVPGQLAIDVGHALLRFD